MDVRHHHCILGSVILVAASPRVVVHLHMCIMRASPAPSKSKARRLGDPILNAPQTHTYNLVLILTRHTLARAGLANRLF